jgi:predicted aspartyl protease
MGTTLRDVVAMGSLVGLVACSGTTTTVTAGVPTGATAPQAATTASAAATPDAPALFARFKEATGGARWDAVDALRSEGTVAAGGLSGPLHSLEELRSGRSVTRFELGPVHGAEGFDGTVAWRQDPGGEVVTLDAPDAREKAITSAWLTAQGYFRLDRWPATFGPVTPRDDAGKHWLVADATPRAGRTVTLWFDAATGLLGRAVERDDSDVETSTMDDYRAVEGVRLPFHVVTDRTDATGRTDPRDRAEVRMESRAVVPLPEASAFAMPAMTPVARIADASGVTRVPFELVNNHIYAQATIDGTPVRVLVDTGGANVLTTAAATRLGVKSEGKLAGRGVGEEHVDVGFAHVGEVRLGGAVLAKPVFYVMDLGDLAGVEGTPSDGLVGFEMFRRFRVTVDYEHRVLTLAEPAKFQPPAGAHVVPFELAERIPIVAAKLDGMPVRLSVDTGSRVSLTLHGPFVRQNGLVERYAAAPETVNGWGVGGPARSRAVRCGELALGDVVVRDVAADLFTGERGAEANPDLSGNLGAGVLRRFTVAFDYDAKKMYLAPNADFARADPYDRSGMWLNADGDALRVAAVLPGGPADKAGIQAGDLVTKLGEPVGKRPVAEWRVRLRELPAGTRLAATIHRPAGDRTVTILLADLIPTHAKH